MPREGHAKLLGRESPCKARTYSSPTPLQSRSPGPWGPGNQYSLCWWWCHYRCSSLTLLPPAPPRRPACPHFYGRYQNGFRGDQRVLSVPQTAAVGLLCAKLSRKQVLVVVPRPQREKLRDLPRVAEQEGLECRVLVWLPGQLPVGHSAPWTGHGEASLLGNCQASVGT